MGDYTIELATCESDYNMDTGDETKECTAQMTVSMTDAWLAGSSVMFHDADSSGTISDGDMIHVSETVDVEWSEVRLYSSSADAYSDENPVFEVPGFTGVVGVLALLGAALLRRKA
jgi:PGF-CTERM protein